MYDEPVFEPPSFASTANLIADPARAAMLTALLDGRALSAGELACASGITAQTASSHLGKLLEGGLVKVEQQGRHRYYRLAGAQIAEALELLATIQPRPSLRQRRLSPEGQRLRFCRCCYNHLAGQVGVAVTEALMAKGYLKPEDDKAYAVTPDGARWFEELGIGRKPLRESVALDLCDSLTGGQVDEPVGIQRSTGSRKLPTLPSPHRNEERVPARSMAGLDTRFSVRHPLIGRQCLDWTERTHHLAGPLGVELLKQMIARGWMQRVDGSRNLRVTAEGWKQLEQLGIHEYRLQGAA